MLTRLIQARKSFPVNRVPGIEELRIRKRPMNYIYCPEWRYGPKDSDLKGVGKALKRSAANAVKLARATKTPFYVMKDGKLIDFVKEKRSK